MNNEESDKWVRDKGYEVTSISIRDEFIPQVVALSEIKNIIGDNYLNQVDVVQLLENKIEELLRKVTLDSL